jgi:uncharacterized protein
MIIHKAASMKTELVFSISPSYAIIFFNPLFSEEAAMKNFLVSLFLLLTLFSCTPSKDSTLTRFIDVAGYGSIEVDPDYVTLTMSIVTVDPSPRESQAKNGKNSQTVIGLLNQMGVEEKWITTLSYNLHEYYEYNYKNDRNEFKGYQTIHDMQIRLIKIDSLPDILSALLESGVTSITSMEYGINNYTDVQNLALLKAVQDARVKAETMVQGENVSVGTLISLKVNSSYDSGIGAIMTQNIMRQQEHSGYEDSFATGARFVRTTVSAQYELASP